MPNWRALQAYGCKDADFKAPGETNVSHMSGGTWKARLSKSGAKHIPSSGGAKKTGGKARIKYNLLPC